MSSARADAFLEGAHRLGQERHEDPVDDEARAIGRDDDLLVEPCGQRADRVEGRIVGVTAADELDERHDRHRAEEVHPDEPLAPGSGDGLCETVDGDRRGVRGEDRVLGGQPVELAPECRLDRDVLEHGLDDEVGGGHRGGVGGDLDPGERGVALLGRQASLRDRPIQVARDPLAARLGTSQLRLIERDRQPDRGMDLGDAVTHESGARDEHPLDRAWHASGWYRAG